MEWVQSSAVVIALAAVGAQAQVAGDVPVLDVLVYNFAGVAKDVLAKAETEADRILGAAGVQVRWRDPSDAAAPDLSGCREPIGGSPLIVRILQRRARAYFRLPSDSRAVAEILGHAFCVRRTHGNSVNIYEASISRMAGSSEARFILLLGYSLAHEIGHLLTGPEHRTGIMARDWAARDVLLAPPNRFLFSMSDARELVERARLRASACVRVAQK